MTLLDDDALWPTELDRVKLPANGAALSTDACAAYGEALGAYRAVCAARAAGPVRDRLDALLAAFGARYEARKRAISGVDFEDLELLTLELLRTGPELRERYARRFERIMVDELQDTNRVQLELIELIASSQPVHGRRRPAVDLPLPARRRGAVRATWRASSPARGERETLRINFRSRPEILEALNAAFETELGERFKPLRRRARRRRGRQRRIPASSCCSSTRAPIGSSKGSRRRGGWPRRVRSAAGSPSWSRTGPRRARSSS